MYFKEYQTGKTGHSFVVHFCNEQGNSNFGEIQFFLQCGEVLFAVIRKFVIVANAVPFTHLVTNVVLNDYKTKPLCTHVKKVQYLQEQALVPVDNLIGKCVFMEIGNDIYISKPPNISEHN